jgi:hypothetical protein
VQPTSCGELWWIYSGNFVNLVVKIIDYICNNKSPIPNYIHFFSSSSLFSFFIIFIMFIKKSRKLKIKIRKFSSLNKTLKTQWTKTQKFSNEKPWMHHKSIQFYGSYTNSSSTFIKSTTYCPLFIPISPFL